MYKNWKNLLLSFLNYANLWRCCCLRHHGFLSSQFFVPWNFLPERGWDSHERLAVFEDLERLPFVRTGRRERTGSHRCELKGQGRSAQLLTRSLRGIHARADVNNMADLATKFSNILPRLSLAEGGGYSVFEWSGRGICIFFFELFVLILGANIADYFEPAVPRHLCDGFRSHFRITSTTFNLHYVLIY